MTHRGKPKFTGMVAGLALLTSLSSVGPAAAQIQVGRSVTINGYSSFEFERRLGESLLGDPNGSFDADLFDLVLNVLPTERVRVAADFTFEHGAATEDGRGNVAIEYAFAEYALGNRMRLRAGKMFTPFGIYNEIHTAKPAFLTVKEPLSTNKNQKFGSTHRFYPRWATGLAFLADGTISGMEVDYVFQLSNGEQAFTNPHEQDNNPAKAFGGRARIRPSFGWEFGLSFYRDRLSIYLDDGTGELVATGGHTELLSYGVHGVWNPAELGVEAEFVYGSTRDESEDRNWRGALTAMVFYSLTERLTPYVRFEYLDPNGGLDNDVARQLVYGVNINIDGSLFLKAELNTLSSQRNNPHFRGEGYTELKAAAVVGF